MNTAINKVKPKDFSFKATTISTQGPIGTQSQRDSKENANTSQNPIEKDRYSQLCNSADVSSVDQSMANRSITSEEGYNYNPNPLTLSQFKSDNDFTGQKQPKAPNLDYNSFKKSSEIQENTTIFNKNLVYKTDPELKEPQQSLRTPFLAEVPRDESFLLRLFSLSGDLIGVWLYLVPFAFYYGGLVLSILVLFMVSLLVYYSEMLLVSCAVLSRKFTMWEIADFAYGRVFASVIRVMLSLYHWCEITISLMFLNQLLAFFMRMVLDVETPDGPSGVWLDPEGKVWTPCLFVCIILPLSFFRNKIWPVAHSFKMGLIIALYITIIVICEAFSREKSIAEEFKAAKSFDATGFISLFPMACYSFCKGDRILLYYQRMKNPNMTRISRELRPARIMNLFIVLAIGMFGYLTWCVKPFNMISYKIILLAPYTKNPALVLGIVCLILVVLFMICESVRVFEMDLWTKNRCATKIASVALLVLSVIFSIFVFQIRQMMIWAGCLICSPVISFFNFTFFFLK